MTREMNKPEWHNKWKFEECKTCKSKSTYCEIFCVNNDRYRNKTTKPKQRVLNPDIEEFVKVLNERLK